MRLAGSIARAIGDNTTIAAVATPLGRGALALVRISGPDVNIMASTLLNPVPTRVRRATHCRVHDATGATIDDVVATLYAAPHSFTGEDLLEISTARRVNSPGSA